MLSSTKTPLAVLILSSIFLQVTQAFCIYNKLSSDVATIDIYDPAHDERTSFKKVIYPGQKECCHFSNTDCNASGDPHHTIFFHGWINHNGFYREGTEKVIKCQAGGGLNIFGSSPEDTRAVCVSPNGSTSKEQALY